MTLERREHQGFAIHELQCLKRTLAAGAGTATKVSTGDLADIRAKDTVLSVYHNTAGVLVDVTGEVSISDLRATGTITLNANPTNGEFVEIGGVRYTFIVGQTGQYRKLVHSGGANVSVGAATNDTANNLAAAIQDAFGKDHPFSVLAASTPGDPVLLTAKQEGTPGNSITLVESSANITLSGATLTGGSDTGGIELSTTDTTGDDLDVLWYQKKRQLSPN